MSETDPVTAAEGEGICAVRCACGWEARGTVDELVEAAREHGARLHNMTPTREQVMAMLVPQPG
jgi:predicted small metal-binding protein